MKKSILFICLLCALCACGNLVKPNVGSENIVQLHAEPVNCTPLYKLETDTAVYSADDARRYLANRISENARSGNAYWITQHYTRPTKWIMFGPEKSFVINANVYDCPDPNNVKFSE